MTLSYDGYNLEADFICGDPKIQILNSKPNLVDAESNNGSIFIGTRYGTSTVEFTIAATGTPTERRNKFSALGQKLFVSSPKKLILPETPDRYYLAVAQGALDLQRCFDGEYATLTFTLTDPVAYSVQERSVTSSGTAAFTVGGTAPTYISVRSTEATSTAYPNYWGVYVTNSYEAPTTNTFMRAVIGNSSDPTTVDINSESRTFKVGSSAVVPTYDSKWLKSNPGYCQVGRKHGDGEFTVRWRDRWY